MAFSAAIRPASSSSNNAQHWQRLHFTSFTSCDRLLAPCSGFIAIVPFFSADAIFLLIVGKIFINEILSSSPSTKNTYLAFVKLSDVQTPKMFLISSIVFATFACPESTIMFEFR